MRNRSLTAGAAALLLMLPAASYAQTQEHAPVSMRGANKLTQDEPRKESWTYISPQFQTARFTSACVLPTKIYDGPDAQFPGTSPADKQRFADMLTGALRREMSKTFTMYTEPHKDCLVTQLILIGVQETKGGMATLSKISPLGIGMSAFRSMKGKQGSFTGSMLVGLEMTSGKDNELLVAAVRRRYPDALDPQASLSTTDTMATVADSVAREVRDRLVGSQVVTVAAR